MEYFTGLAFYTQIQSTIQIALLRSVKVNYTSLQRKLIIYTKLEQ